MSQERPQSSEMSPGPGFIVRSDIDRTPAELVAGISMFETSDISDAMNRLYTMGGTIHNLTNEMALTGPAVTVKAFPGDNLMVHKALDLVRPGDVIVVDASQSMTAALLGDMIASKAKHLGVAGFVIDGLIRDLPGVKETGLPVFARGVTPFGPLHRGPGEVNGAISCGGIVVQPGDVISADQTGVTVVPKVWAEDVLNRLRANADRLADYTRNVRSGTFSNAWVDRQLRSDGCVFE